MTGFFGRFFGAGKKKADVPSSVELVESLVGELVEKAGLDVSFSIEFNEGKEEVNVNFSGEDEELFQAKEGQLLESVQLFVRRVIQHQFPDEKWALNVDAGGFRDRTNEELIDLAEKLKHQALSRGKSVYFRALAPKDRKVVHQYLSEDERVKSRSVGEGHYKKIKIFPVKGGSGEALSLDK